MGEVEVVAVEPGVVEVVVGGVVEVTLMKGVGTVWW